MPSALPPPAVQVLLGQELLRRGQVAEADLERALAFQAQSPGDRLGAILVRLGALSEENLLAALAAQTGYAIVTLADIPRSGVDGALRRLDWPAMRLHALQAVVWEDGEGALNACAVDPLDAALQEAVEAAAGAPAALALHPPP